MKKLFISVLALAAFAACQSDFNNDLNVNVPQQGGVNVGGSHTIYAEVGIGGETKATYGDDLKATWEENDQIALLQEHADYGKGFNVVNKLTIKSGWGTNSAAFNGDISVDATSPRVYHIAYPTSAVSFNTSVSVSKTSDSSYAYREDGLEVGHYYATASFNHIYNSTLNITVPAQQSGMWEPYMYASTSEAVSSEGIGAKELTTLTGAIAIRAFESDGVTPKQLKSITITSSDAAIAGAFSGTATSVGSLGTITGAETSDVYSTVSEENILMWKGAKYGREEAEKLLLDKAQSTEPTSTAVTKNMSLSFVGNERVITLTNLENIPMDSEGYYTYYVNVAPATVGTLEIQATDLNGGEIDREVSNQTFAASHRKGYKLTWKEATMVPGTVETWYNNWNASSFELAGNTIYARNLGVNGVPADHVLALGIEINGQLHEASAKSGVLSAEEIKVEGVENGTYTVCTYAKVMLNGYEKVFKGDAKTVVVTSIPTATYSIYSSYSNNGAQSLRNDVGGNVLRANVSLSDSYIQSNYVQSATLTYGSASASMTAGKEWSGTVANGSYNASIKVVLKNGYTLTSSSYTTHVTGIPYTMDVTKNDGTWIESNNSNVKWNNSGGVRLGYNSDNWTAANNNQNITKTFHIPANITVKVTANGVVNGTQGVFGTAKVENTATVTVGSTTVVSKTQNGSSEGEWSCSNASASMSSSSNVVKINCSYCTAGAKVVVKALTIQY
ncbi:MAG: hypothetical protein IKU93_04230 [Alistipes sp.]|nr:hypothetical protein [Alistipes sp.]